MLSPAQLEAAGDAVAAIYNGIEARMLDHLVGALLSIGSLDQATVTELALLSQTHGPKLQAILDTNRESIADEVYATAERLLKASDADDVARAGGPPMWPRQIEATVQGVGRILARDNLKMVEGAKRAFLDASVEAITRVNSGTMTAERALHSAVRRMERQGIPIVTYQNSKTGMVTVENKVDVAVRRHVRTQIAQDGARMTMERMERLGIDLVEVSSHEDSRPEHSEWQGRVYSLKGDTEVEGVRYRDFYEATGYGSVDGLMGANCRHSFGPYRHGAPRAYEPNPQPACGIPGDELYRLEQQQRYMERRIREDKRELRGAQMIYDKDPSIANRAALMKAKERLKSSQEGMRDLIKDANAKSKRPGVEVLHRRTNREWAGDMPKVKSTVALAAEGKVTRKAERNAYSVKRRVVNGEAYKERIGQLGLPKRAAASVHQQALRILEDRDGTSKERLVAISWRNGELIADTFGRKPVDFASGFTPEQVAKLEKVEGGVILLHNHPGNSKPSATDIMTLAGNGWCRASVVACHDGTVYMPLVLKNGVVEAYNEIIGNIKSANPYISDRESLERMAQSVLYEENEKNQWFKVMKK